MILRNITYLFIRLRNWKKTQKSSTQTYNKNTINSTKHINVNKCQYDW